MQGTVKFFDTKKGWGFISSDSDNKDYFIYQANIKMKDFRHLTKMMLWILKSVQAKMDGNRQ